MADYAREVVREYLQLHSEQESDDNKLFQGFRVSGRQVAVQFREANPDLFSEGLGDAKTRRKAALDQWLTDPPEAMYGLAELAAMFELNRDDVEIFIMAAAPAIDPAVEQLYSYVRNDVHKRSADVGFVCQLLSLGKPGPFHRLFKRCSFDAPLRKNRLLLIEERQSPDDKLDLNLVSRRCRAADQVLEFLGNYGSGIVQPVDESLAQVCVRLNEQVEIDSLGLESFTRETLIQLARTRTLPVVFQGPVGAGKRLAAQALAGPMKAGVLCADLAALLQEPPETLDVLLAELFREAHLGGDLVYLYGHDLVGEISGPTMLVLERALLKSRLVLGVDSLPLWGTTLTVGWPSVTIPLPNEPSRMKMWRECFSGDRLKPSEKSLVQVARRYQLSKTQIRQAAAEARRLAQVSRRKNLDLTELDRACRAHFAHQLSELAQLIPPTSFAKDDLILPKKETAIFEEVLLYAQEQESIYDEWGFGEKFPYGRGLTVMFFGPPGTGKTMGAVIIAATLGLDLYRVDVSCILSRYVGETEKNLARIFDEAERGRCMLLFDEADSLFTRRTDVQTSVDRYANLEVAYLLQRMENFLGVTVLTTNVEHLLDDAFKRRLRYKIYFPLPEADIRAKLWASFLPKSAPVEPNIPFDLLGEQYELSGGNIKQAVLRSAVYARRDKKSIGLLQLIEAAQQECREAGYLVTENFPKALAKALAEAKGEVWVDPDSNKRMINRPPKPIVERH